MAPFVQLSFVMAMIIIAAKAGGYISFRFGQPTVLGELLVGVVLGPSVIDLLHWPFFTDLHLPEVIHQLAELGVLLLMFIAGLDLHLDDLRRTGRVAVLAGVFGVLAPLTLGTGVGLVYSTGWLPAIFIGLILSATSVSISAQTLMELNVLRSRVGLGMLGAAIFDDILVVLGLSVFLALTGIGPGGGAIGVVWIVLRMAIFLLLALSAGRWILPRLSRRVTRLPISQGLVAFTVVTILLFGWAAEVIGNMAAITGAFLAGLLLARSPVRDRIEAGISSIAYGVFVPIFFVNVGLSANARELTGETIGLMLVLTLTAVIGKVLGAGAGARLGGFSSQEALQLGVGMMSRGEVGLIVASVGIAQRVIQQEIFSAIVGVVIITTLLTPPLLRSLFKATPPAGEVERANRPTEQEGGGK